MKLLINEKKDYLIGNIRFTREVFEKASAIAKKKKVSRSKIIRAIVEQNIDKVEL